MSTTIAQYIKHQSRLSVDLIVDISLEKLLFELLS